MPWQNGFTYKRQINFDHTQVGSTDSTDIPLVIGNQGALAYLATVANGGFIQNTVTVNAVSVPADLIFTSDSAGSTLLSWEVASYDPTTGNIEIWVKVPTLNHLTTDTIIYMWYGNSGVSTYQCTYTDVWSNGFAAVYHFGDGSTLVLKDSTANANHGTNTGGTAGSGKVGGGLSLDGSSHFVDIGAGASLDITGAALSIECWARFDGSFGAAFPRVFSKLAGPPYNGYELVLDPSPLNNMFIQVGNASTLFISPGVGDPQPAISTGTWYHMVGTYDNLFGRYYQDSSLIATHTWAGSAIGSSGGNAYIGQFASGGAFWTGVIDELRISNVTRNGDWVLASRNNQAASSTLVTIGGQQLNESIALGCSAGTSDSGTVAYTPSLTFGVSAGTAESSQLAAANSIALGVGAACLPTVISNIMESITLGVGAHIGESVTVQLFLALGLGVGAGLTESAQLAAVNSLSLGVGAGETFAAKLAAVSSITLAAACGCSESAALAAIASLAFGMMAGVAETAKLAAVNSMTFGVGVDVVAPGSANKETSFSLAVALASAVMFVKSGGPGGFTPDTPGTPGGFRGNTAGTPGAFRSSDNDAPGVFRPDQD